MAIVQRFWTMIKSNLNHLIGKGEDPEKMLNQMLLDMQEQLINAKKQVAVSIADEKRLLKQYNDERALAQDWEQKAMLAVKAGKDDLARQALERKSEHEKLATGFEEQWRTQQQAVEQLKSALSTLNEKITDAKRKKNLLVARAKRAEAQKTITDTMSGMSNTNALDTISRMEQKIDQMEAEASAATELANEIQGDELSAQFKKLEVVGSDDALAALKEKMGVSTSNTKQENEETELKKIEKELEAHSKR
ncbi:MAG: PspA/IM30 family protein [Myxococcales bacterium]|nr:PspA/IM30 family protein [Myxococcales bacterium]USN50066.1 MAG: PspA/IM30 family protein [Myxococcales bacterium]